MSPKNKSTQTNLFSKSVLNAVVKGKMESHGFVHSLEHFTSNIEFYSEDVKKSKKLHEFQFTNFLRNNTPDRIKQRIFALVQTPSDVDNQHLEEVRVNEKVAQCVKLYVNNLSDEAIIYKSDLRDPLNDTQQGVRVYIIFELPDDDPDMKVVFKIVLIDPFHLVIPSKHGGMSKKTMEKQTYRENASNNICISDWLKKV